MASGVNQQRDRSVRAYRTILFGSSHWKGEAMKLSGMTGQELSRLMRQHRVTIRELSRRTQITQKRIRRARQLGLPLLASLDFAEAIRGHLTDRERACLAQYREQPRALQQLWNREK